ncbi:MAG: 4,5:9,10-diseco-3-hydroxy-5,9,17-trioxoandrosta-1(10),2-diene-4-oate hydrolase [Alphaproteobacteria bacterium]|nr:4,5:9,10-diseco-3-hydroxy-5,9,17-trioxoandrosta-1(10),2-diene-4-oate hydrolase [Alphaproteobacteria bacterium]
MAITEADTSKFVQAGKVRVHYNEAGSGDPLVLIHGGGPGATGWSNYQRNVDELSKHFRCLMIDLPGFGKTDKVRPDTGLFAFFAEVIRDMLNELKIDKAHFIGNSLGGGTALKFALDYPDRAGRLVLMGPGGSVPLFTPWPSEGIKHLFSFYEGEGPTMAKLKAFIDVMVVDKSELTEALYEQRFKSATDPETVKNPPLRMRKGMPLEELWKENLAGLKHEFLLIWGREDRVIPLDMSLFLLNRIQKAQLHVFPNCGHWAQWEKAPEFNRIVAGFIKG